MSHRKRLEPPTGVTGSERPCAGREADGVARHESHAVEPCEGSGEVWWHLTGQVPDLDRQTAAEAAQHGDEVPGEPAVEVAAGGDHAPLLGANGRQDERTVAERGCEGGAELAGIAHARQRRLSVKRDGGGQDVESFKRTVRYNCCPVAVTFATGSCFSTC